MFPSNQKESVASASIAFGSSRSKYSAWRIRRTASRRPTSTASQHQVMHRHRQDHQASSASTSPKLPCKSSHAVRSLPKFPIRSGRTGTAAAMQYVWVLGWENSPIQPASACSSSASCSPAACDGRTMNTDPGRQEAYSAYNKTLQLHRITTRLSF